MIKPHTSTIIFVSHFLFIEWNGKQEAAEAVRHVRKCDHWAWAHYKKHQVAEKAQGGAPKDLYVHADYWLWM